MSTRRAQRTSWMRRRWSQAGQAQVVAATSRAADPSYARDSDNRSFRLLTINGNSSRGNTV